SWHASCALGGSPSAVDTGCPPRPGIVVNELLSYGDPALDALELYNPTPNDVNIGGWFLSDDSGTLKKYTIPANTIITAGGYVVFTENDFNPGGAGFAFGSRGDEVYLSSGDGVNLTGYRHGFDFGASEHAVTFGRYVDSQ